MARWFRFRIGAWMSGTDDLTLEQEAAYLRIIAAINLYDEPVRNNLMVLGGLWRCNQRKAKRLLDELIEAGKLEIRGSLICNSQALADIEERSRSQSPGPKINGLGGENAPSITRRPPVNSPSTSNSRDIHEGNSPSKPLKTKKVAPKRDPVDKRDNIEYNGGSDLDEAYEIWNALAEKYPSLPAARNQKGPTQDKLRARLKEGGLEGFRLAMAGIERSPWHRNEDDWQNMNFAWAMNRTNFEKLQMLGEGPAQQPKAREGNAGSSFWASYKARHGKD